MRATAKVTVQVEVSVGSSWGDSCSVAQIHQQASREAINIIKQKITDKVRIVSTPIVDVIILNGDRS